MIEICAASNKTATRSFEIDRQVEEQVRSPWGRLRPKAAVAFAAPSLVVSDSYMSFVGHLELIQPGSKVLNGSLARVTRTVLVFCRSEQESVKPRLAASVRPGNREPPYLVDADGPTEESLVLTRCLQSIDP